MFKHLSNIMIVQTDLASVRVFEVVACRGEEVAFGQVFPQLSNLVGNVLIILPMAMTVAMMLDDFHKWSLVAMFSDDDGNAGA